MIMTTTPSIEGKHISKYLGVVNAAKIYNWGGLIGEGLSKADDTFEWSAYLPIVTSLRKKAEDFGADAIVGLQMNVSSLNGTVAGSQMFVVATGTAVKLTDATYDDLPDL
ncbi:MAG: heavy metal-binding domain-containing protein [Bacteroidaceae bacterium]|nr:heavy metal-binding domain-containing protein [Bacteroidaceae bacterium]